jgi:hypothetical protein
VTSGDVDCQQQLKERNKMRRATLDLIALVERGGGYADVPPGSISDELEVELAVHGYATGLSDRLWLGGYRVYSPESIAAGNYRPQVLCSVFTCAEARYAHVPDAGEFDIEAVLAERGELPRN